MNFVHEWSSIGSALAPKWLVFLRGLDDDSILYLESITVSDVIECCLVRICVRNESEVNQVAFAFQQRFITIINGSNSSTIQLYGSTLTSEADNTVMFDRRCSIILQDVRYT